ncbi:cellobiose dehydrogenase [Lophium mytilinum]|uniref:Cellobiose dehydrogenase n=1 Tax=Lophium mytilinum TaxID=390894 RepID=A0A6A6QXJ4_9PEZI|nr:cellobiose dehydrogenase [Lophium mytilinum]
MRISYLLGAVSLLASPLLESVSAQATGDFYTDPTTNITFWRSTIAASLTTGGFQWGYALPGAAGGTNDEYIGLIVGALQGDAAGWSGMSHRGAMTNSLLLMAWPDGTDIKTSFRFSSGYVTPDIYTGNATLTEISHTINATHFTLIYRCQWCWYWDQDGSAFSQPPTSDTQVIGWVQNNEAPNDPTNPDTTITEHDNGNGEFGAPVASARNSAYSTWVSLATSTPTSSPTVTPTSAPVTTTTSISSTQTVPTTCSGTAAPTGTWDYIVVGAGAAGIPLADKLSEAGKSVLLIERGPPSSGRWGGTTQQSWTDADWLDGTNLTRFDVPGLCNQIWHDASGIACTDIDQMAGCVLGGGTAVNAALWWKPNPVDWDYNFPAGWKSSDMSAATSRVFSRIPGTDHPSADGQLYLQQGYNVLSSALSAGGWKYVVPNDVPSSKDMVYGHTPYMFSHGERGGPMATYLVTASARSNFKLLMNTSVRRVIRTGGHVTGVELEKGACGTVNVTAGTGRVILSAGTFGSTKILYRSGIGPTDQLNIVRGSPQDGATMVNNASWINLPVGKNLNDHVNTDLVIQHPNITFYDFYAAFTDPIAADKSAYLDKRTGILTQAAPNIGPMFWQVVNGTDGITRQLQWTARVEGPNDNDTHSMTMSQYLGRGTTSRGALSISGALSIYVSTAPYLIDQADTDAVIQGIDNVKAAIARIPGITWEVPADGVTTADYVASLPKTPSARRSNHWIGTSKLGTDSGLSDGTAVVDINTRVYGTDNLFVVDASIFPGMMTTNPSAYIVIVAEQAAAKILALAAPTAIAAYQQCGGSTWTGSRYCVSGYTCYAWNWSYSQCVPS